MSKRDDIVKVMQSWVGKKESDGSHKSIIDIYNAEKPLPNGYAVKYTDAWCDTTVSAAAIAAGVSRDIFPRECGCGRHIELFKKIGVWIENDAYVPQPGDVIFYDWQDSGIGDNVGTPDHVGIVEKCDGKTIAVIEGNKSNAVGRRNVAVNGKYIRGFAAPKYVEVKTTPSNSLLVTYTRLSPNCSKPRNHAIDTITIHCVVGHCTVQTVGEVFAPTSRQASSNYGVDDKGGIGLYVHECDRSWCTSSSANDNRAITIEVASDSAEPYAFTDKAYATLLDLVTDICKRNGIKLLVWSTDKNTRVNHLNGCNLTVHRDYAAKSCPGNWMYGRMGVFASEVNMRLGVTVAMPTPTAIPHSASTPFAPYTIKVTASELNIRRGSGTNYATAGSIKDKGIYTIVEEANGAGAKRWGRLKSGAGWISLDYTTKI